MLPVSPPRSPGSLSLDRVRCRSLSLLGRPQRRLCTLHTPSGSDLIVTCPCCSTSGPMSCVGSSSIPRRSSAHVNSSGRRVTRHTPPSKMLPSSSTRFRKSMPRSTKSSWPALLSAVASLRTSVLLAHRIPLLSSYTFQSVVVASRVLPPIISARTSPRCSR